jgi:hypothetical protein
MVGQRLDRLSKGLAVAPESRRLTLRRLVQSGFTALLLPFERERAAARKKKRKKCKNGHKRCHRKCIPATACCTDAECGTVPCLAHNCDCTGRADSTDCGGGRQCSGNVCATPPACLGFGETCVDDVDCCGLSCVSVPMLGHLCTCSSGGRSCQGAGDCCSGLTCVGFVCQ